MTSYGGPDDHEATLRLIARRRQQLHNEQRNLDELVRNARAAGITWTELGRALSVSRQAAVKRYGAAADVVEATADVSLFGDLL